MILIILFVISIGIVSAEKQSGAASKEQGPVKELRLNPVDFGNNTEYGRSVAIDDNLIAVGMGADGQDGRVYLYRRQGTNYVPEATLSEPAGTAGAEFGRSVVIKGNTVFVGARFAQAGDVSKAGAIYVFRNSKGSWHFEEKIVSPDPKSEDNFGRALSVQGNLMVVTARKENQSDPDVGAAYVFVNKGGIWTFKQKITASDPSSNAYFGQSVVLHGDILAIGARNANPNGAGAFYLFRQSGDGWKEIAKVTPEIGKKNDQYGFSLAISGDTIAVGARRADPGGLEDAGAVYLYTLRKNTVNHVATLAPGDIGDEFGQSVAFAGSVLAVGAWRDDIDGNADQGSIYLFRQNGGQWVQTDKIMASDGVAGDEFGYSLAAFGNRMVTGAHKADFIGTDAGTAYVLLLN